MDLIDLIESRKRADVGMAQAAEHADETHPGWTEEAYSFLISFARDRLHFISEDVSGAHKAAGYRQAPTDRAWGSVYRRAAKAGIIVKDGTGISLRRHGSICPKWRSKIFIEEGNA